MAEPSTFNAAVDSTSEINHDGYHKSNAKIVAAKCVDFAEVGSDNYDLVSIGVEGDEYYIL